MYIPAAFAPGDDAEIHAFVAEHPFAALVSGSPADGLSVTHLPFETGAASAAPSVLVGHMARANPHWRTLDATGRDAVAIFGGPDAYVTPNWYPAKRDHGRVVPTWNYAVVHAYGRLRIHDDVVALRRHLDALTAEHEAGRPEPWSLADTPEGFIEQQMQGIVAVELVVERWEGKWKLSQNRSAADIRGVITGLGAGDAEERAVARLVEARCPASKRTVG